MEHTKQKPRTRNDRPLLPFVAILVLNVLIGGLFFFQDQLPLLPGEPSNLWPLGILLLIAVLLLGLYSLTGREPSFYTLCQLVALFEICFVFTQYCFIRSYQIFGLHSSERITHGKWDALYFSIITWTTTGYGDLVPVGASRWFACSEALLGTLFKRTSVGFCYISIESHDENKNCKV